VDEHNYYLCIFALRFHIHISLKSIGKLLMIKCSTLHFYPLFWKKALYSTIWTTLYPYDGDLHVTIPKINTLLHRNKYGNIYIFQLAVYNWWSMEPNYQSREFSTPDPKDKFISTAVIQCNVNDDLTKKGLKVHTCRECDKIFLRKKDMLLHVMTHTGEYPFPCHLCRAKFRRADRLRKHLLTFKHCK
jgi:hypothetical protein